MPILEVDRAEHVVVLKRSMATGFAGIDNELFYNPKTMMLFGDAKGSVEQARAGGRRAVAPARRASRRLQREEWIRFAPSSTRCSTAPSSSMTRACVLYANAAARRLVRVRGELPAETSPSC